MSSFLVIFHKSTKWEISYCATGMDLHIRMMASSYNAGSFNFYTVHLWLVIISCHFEWAGFMFICHVFFSCHKSLYPWQCRIKLWVILSGWVNTVYSDFNFFCVFNIILCLCSLSCSYIEGSVQEVSPPSLRRLGAFAICTNIIV